MVSAPGASLMKRSCFFCWLLVLVTRCDLAWILLGMVVHSFAGHLPRILSFCIHEYSWIFMGFKSSMVSFSIVMHSPFALTWPNSVARWYKEHERTFWTWEGYTSDHTRASCRWLTLAILSPNSRDISAPRSSSTHVDLTLLQLGGQDLTSVDRWDWEELDDVAHVAVARSVQQLDLILADARAARDGMVGRDGIGGYPLVNIHKTMERSTILNREINYFNGHFQ